MLGPPLGIEVKFKNMVYPVLLAPDYIPELHVVTQTEDGELLSAGIRRRDLWFHLLWTQTFTCWSQISGGCGRSATPALLQRVL